MSSERGWFLLGKSITGSSASAATSLPFLRGVGFKLTDCDFFFNARFSISKSLREEGKSLVFVGLAFGVASSPSLLEMNMGLERRFWMPSSVSTG